MNNRHPSLSGQSFTLPFCLYLLPHYLISKEAYECRKHYDKNVKQKLARCILVPLSGTRLQTFYKYLLQFHTLRKPICMRACAFGNKMVYKNEIAQGAGIHHTCFRGSVSPLNPCLPEVQRQLRLLRDSQLSQVR